MSRNRRRAANYANTTRRWEKQLIKELQEIRRIECSLDGGIYRLYTVECSRSIHLTDKPRQSDITMILEAPHHLFLRYQKELSDIKNQIKTSLKKATTTSFSITQMSFQTRSVIINIQVQPASPLQKRKELDVSESDEPSNRPSTFKDHFQDSGFTTKTEDDQTSTRSVESSKTIRSQDQRKQQQDQTVLQMQRAPAPGAVKLRKFDGKYVTDFHFVKSQESQTEQPMPEKVQAVEVKKAQIPSPDTKTIHKSMQLAKIRDYECMLRVRRYLSYYHECETLGFKHETKITHEMYLRSQGLPANFVELKQLYVEALLPFYTSKNIADDLQMCRNMIKTERLIHMCRARDADTSWRTPRPVTVRPLYSSRSSSSGTCDPECCILM